MEATRLVGASRDYRGEGLEKNQEDLTEEKSSINDPERRVQVAVAWS